MNSSPWIRTRSLEGSLSVGQACDEGSARKRKRKLSNRVKETEGVVWKTNPSVPKRYPSPPDRRAPSSKDGKASFCKVLERVRWNVYEPCRGGWIRGRGLTSPITTKTNQRREKEGRKEERGVNQQKPWQRRFVERSKGGKRERERREEKRKENVSTQKNSPP